MPLDFEELFIIFSLEGNEIKLKGIQGNPTKVIISNIMIKLLNERCHGVCWVNLILFYLINDNLIINLGFVLYL
jgi:hypothetical protein